MEESAATIAAFITDVFPSVLVLAFAATGWALGRLVGAGR